MQTAESSVPWTPRLGIQMGGLDPDPPCATPQRRGSGGFRRAEDPGVPGPHGWGTLRVICWSTSSDTQSLGGELAVKTHMAIVMQFSCATWARPQKGVGSQSVSQTGSNIQRNSIFRKPILLAKGCCLWPKTKFRSLSPSNSTTRKSPSM